MKFLNLILVFVLFSLVFTPLFAQVEEKPKVDDKTEIDNINSIQAVGDKIEFKNESINSILTITDEGSNSASILNPQGPTLVDPNDDSKLWNNFCQNNEIWYGSKVERNCKRQKLKYK